MSDWSEMAGEDLLVLLSDVQSARNALDARMLGIVAEVEERGLASENGYRDTADLLASLQLVSPGMARARVAGARAVVPQWSLIGEELPAALPATAEAVGAAAVSLEHVTVIRKAMGALPTHLQAAKAESLERDLASIARTVDPDSLRKAAQLALSLLDPDGPRPRDGAPSRNRLRFVERGDGYEAKGWLDSESAAVVRTALSPLAVPVGEHGPGECAEPNCEHGAGERVPDGRSMAERDGDALVELCRRMLDSGALPTEGGERPHLTVTIPLASLQAAGGAGLLEFGDGIGRSVLCAEEVRRLACDGAVVPVVLGSRGEPLDVGRRSRVVTVGMRRALDARDGGCAHPGCGLPARWTEAHHVEHWADGGVTAVDNLVLLCGRHHRLQHKGEWRITMEAGLPVFHPPWWTGIPPSRNLLHRPDLIGAIPAPRPEVRRLPVEELVGV
ncbi:HNH endonuclease signature motif containing protein [Pseudonocardia oroxyli]|nr:HNH endonuclease signature motif containing protein [Pseudonocardia oroxyli]